MKDVCFKEAYEKYGQYEDWYRSANYCAGSHCPEYDNCKARKEFDDLPKYSVTDYELENACTVFRTELAAILFRTGFENFLQNA